MAGVPWMLDAREKIKSGLMLAPSLAVAGPLINSFGLEGYAVVVRDPLDARRSVRQQAACGYDFIKTWNVLPEPIFNAVAEQARLEGMDLVGHVPQGITVPHAIAMGMRTMEHLKGFIDDRTLQLGETDYVSAAAENVWNTPTLYAGRSSARGAEARAYLHSEEMRYVPIRRRAAWEQLLEKPEGRVDRLRSDARVIMKDIVRQLYAVHAHFLAGTDSDGYPFQVSGFALLDELNLLHDAGLSRGEVLRSATTEAARAMREPEEFGQIRAGFRADLIVLNTNPIEHLAAFRRNRGVMVHGFWLDRSKLDQALSRLAEVSQERDEDVELSESVIRSTIQRVQRLSNSGFVLSSPKLMTLAGEIRKAGNSGEADELERLANIPAVGPCGEARPN